jgi:hypothetical protein
LSVVANVERPRPESWLSLLWLLVVGISVVVLLVCAAALLATIEFVYRQLIAAPIAWLLMTVAGLAPHGAAKRH